MPAAQRIRQFFTALTARIASEEQAVLERHLSQSQRSLFQLMPVNDQRHALNVLYKLRALGLDDPHLLQAALLHDVGKSQGRIGLPTRVAVVLLGLVDRRLVARLADARGRPWQRALFVQVNHAALGAELAARAGSHPEVVRLIREHEWRSNQRPTDSLAQALREADDRS